MPIRIKRGDWTIECDTAQESVEVLDRIGQAIAAPLAPASSSVTAQRRRAKDPEEKEPTSGLPKHAPSKENCEFPDCTKRLRSDSKTCEPCSRRLCSQHIDRKTLLCADCAARP